MSKTPKKPNRAAPTGRARAFRPEDENSTDILDNLSEAFIALDRKWRCIYLNRAAERFVGLQRDEILGRIVWELFPEKNTAFESACRRAMQERVTVQFEEYCAPLDTWLEEIVYPSASGIIVYARNINARKHADEVLRASQERFGRYFELGLVGMAITSPSKGLIEVNDQLCEIVGYSRSELLQMSWAEITHPDDLAADVANFNRVLAGEFDGYLMDKRYIRKDGKVISVRISVRCLRRADGSVDYFIGLVQDNTARKRAEQSLERAHRLLERRVTERTRQLLTANEELTREIAERKRAEERLKESERRFRLMVDAIPHHVFNFISGGSVGYCNQRLLDYIGLTLEQVKQSGLETIHPDDVEGVRVAWDKALKEGTPYEMEQRVRGRDGRYRRFLCRAIPVPDEHGQPVEWFGTHTDIEDLRRAEETLHQAQADLARVARVAVLGELVATFAHESSRTPGEIVTRGKSPVNWLSKPDRNLDKVWAGSQAAVEQQPVHAIPESLAASAEVRPARGPLLRVNELIQRVLGVAEPEIIRHALFVRTQLAEDLPLVAGDHLQLQQVILNLVINAIEATSAKGEGPREIFITSQMHGADQVVVAVRDWGIGIDPQNMPKIFAPFFTTKAGSIGMGLSISRSIVESHGGRLWVEAGEREGTIVQFSLRARAEKTAAAAHAVAGQ